MSGFEAFLFDEAVAAFTEADSERLQEEDKAKRKAKEQADRSRKDLESAFDDVETE